MLRITLSIPQNIKNYTMTFHTTRQFHTTILHDMLLFIAPFCTTSHSVVHPGHRHSTSYNIPFHITPYNKYLSSVPSVVSFKSALKTRLFSSGCCLLCLCAWSVLLVSCVCVCSGHIPHHRCCSVYVISTVQIAFRTTSHHIKRFHITHHSITSYQKILHRTIFHITPFHTTPFHIKPPLHNIPHHITTYHMFNATSQTFNVATYLALDHHILHLISHYTTVCLPPPCHTTTSRAQHNIPHHTVHISHHSTPTAIPHHTHIQHHSTFHTIFHITPPHLTSQHIALFSTSDIAQQSHSPLHMPHSSPPQFHTTFRIT